MLNTKNIERGDEFMKGLMTKKKGLIILTCLVTVLLLSISAFALYMPDLFYSNRCSTYSYLGPVNPNYNCLAYAMGYSSWEWPWGASNPQPYLVDSYMVMHGKRKVTVATGNIISYGSSSQITHFSKAVAFQTVEAKWGELELFTHYLRSPYPEIGAGSDQWGTYGYGTAISGYN